MRAEVLVFIFSGRENPSWFLSEEETKSILDQIRTLTPAGTEKTFQREGLGYRGFDIRWQAKGTGSYSRLSVYMGLILTDRSHLSLDPMRKCERALANSAAGRVSPEIEKLIQSSIAA